MFIFTIQPLWSGNANPISLMKRIAVLIPVYNRQPGLEKTLRSLADDVDLIDIVIVDDGSTPPIQLNRESGLSMHLIRLPENRGVEHALNVGLEYIYDCKYDFICRIDADDTTLAGRFAMQLAYLEANQDIGLLGGSFYMENHTGETMLTSILLSTPQDVFRAMYLLNFFLPSTTMMRTSVAIHVGLHSSEFPAAEDYDFYMRMIRCSNGAIFHEPLANYVYDDPRSISNSKRSLQIRSMIRIRFRYFSPLNIYSYAGIALGLGSLVLSHRRVSKLRRGLERRLVKSIQQPPI